MIFKDGWKILLLLPEIKKPAAFAAGFSLSGVLQRSLAPTANGEGNIVATEARRIGKRDIEAGGA